MTATAVTFAFIVGLAYKKFGQRELLVFSTLVLYIVPFLLPQMHERYFYSAEVSSLVLAFAYPSFAWITVLMQVVTFCAYYPFLFGPVIVPFQLLSLGVLVIICGLCVLYMHAERLGSKDAAV
jgi:hypothetical protein